MWVEGNQTELRCEIENVGPGHKLSVRWSRADPKHNNAFTQFNETSFPDLVNKTNNVSMTVNLTITPSREDDGVQYQCAAVLNVDQPPLNYTSQPLNITVYYKPNITQPLNEALSITEEDQGQYICTAYNDVGQATRNVTVTVIAGHNPHFIYYIVAIIVMVVSAVVIAVCCTYYRRTRMGQYILKHLRSRRHNGYLDHNAEDQAQL
ncbi:hypothetical protein PHYPO_G00156590 [Pangasianodon hypophthalmus]|uniref:Ig-like domain-containing protein n=1 Tax=Pangasianodon hypophthalmus TaxID=310915 RepID=A0A5N5JXK0_PANHP|nr:hypothetical protein PHYPO_G00156590 [Pangasianodon hypophthalmus]